MECRVIKRFFYGSFLSNPETVSSKQSLHTRAFISETLVVLHWLWDPEPWVSESQTFGGWLRVLSGSCAPDSGVTSGR